MTIRVNLGARLIIFIYLCNRVFSLNDGQDTFLLDRRWLLESVGIDTSQDFFLKSHLVEFLNFLIPVCFETFFSFLSYIDQNTSDKLHDKNEKDDCANTYLPVLLHPHRWRCFVWFLQRTRSWETPRWFCYYTHKSERPLLLTSPCSFKKACWRFTIVCTL